MPHNVDIVLTVVGNRKPDFFCIESNEFTNSLDYDIHTVPHRYEKVLEFLTGIMPPGNFFPPFWLNNAP